MQQAECRNCNFRPNGRNPLAPPAHSEEVAITSRHINIIRRPMSSIRQQPQDKGVYYIWAFIIYICRNINIFLGHSGELHYINEMRSNWNKKPTLCGRDFRSLLWYSRQGCAVFIFQHIARATLQQRYLCVLICAQIRAHDSVSLRMYFSE